uniref:Calsyntenin-2 n=1 Tax=Astyanax mexicanus TaxID=7994 RepID=A0A3B1J3J9_ASTMX
VCNKANCALSGLQQLMANYMETTSIRTSLLDFGCLIVYFLYFCVCMCVCFFLGEICAFRVYGLDAPFEAVVLNRTSGEGQLQARRPIDCEHQREHTFIIQAHDCGAGPGGTGGKRSHKAVVHVQVGDVNEFSPVFSSLDYSGSVLEGRVYDSILQVQASDQDCSPQYSQICNYQITTEDTPFAIDRNGKIHTHTHTHTHTQWCKKRTHTHTHTQYWNTSRWTKRVDYEPGTGSKQLFPKMHLETCEELQTSHIGKGCDRETYSEKSLQKLCGASSGSTDLLPAPSAAFNWTASLLTDGGRDSDLIYRFDGRQAAKIPHWISPQNLTDQFTIATWMKHGPSPGLRGEKETLLCNSDKTEMNRHHYSLYVHNCRLVFLLRRDFTQGDSFRPAEFHWKLEQICDKEWHYYVINVEFPVVTLYVDGVTYDPYLVTDDWPIHSSKIDVQLTVGACWQGQVHTETNRGDKKCPSHFRGSLSGLTLRPGKIESQKVISCLQACKEGLDITSLESLEKGIKFHFNPAQSVLVMEGEDLDQVNTALRKVSYINSRQFPTPGARRLHISTTVQCFGEDVCISIPDIEAVVMVMQPSEPRITITGAEQLNTPASDLAAGLSLFRDLHIVSTVTKKHRSGVLEEMVHNLDYCDILVLGEELKGGLESLQLPRSALLGKHLDYTNSTTGVDSLSHYVQVIRQVRFQSLQKGASVRSFRLTCSELNGRYTSNQFTLQVNVLHREKAVKHVSHLVAPPRYTPLIHQPIVATTGQSVANAVTIVIVVCITALVVMVVLGVYQLYLTHMQEDVDAHSYSEKHSDLDLSALTITVNPLELQPAEELTEEEVEDEEEEEEDDDDVSSSESDSDEEEPTTASMQPQTKTLSKIQWPEPTAHC